MAEGMKRDPHGLICALKAKKGGMLSYMPVLFYRVTPFTMSQCSKTALGVSHTDAATMPELATELTCI